MEVPCHEPAGHGKRESHRQGPLSPFCTPLQASVEGHYRMASAAIPNRRGADML
jgi:hypothetical protein